MFMRAKATPLKPPNTMLPIPRKVGIMITHVVGARHPNIVAGVRGGGGQARRKLVISMHMKLQMTVRVKPRMKKKVRCAWRGR